MPTVDGMQFDKLARAVARHDRRRVLSAVIGVLGGTVAMSSVLTNVQAQGNAAQGEMCTAENDCEQSIQGMCTRGSRTCEFNGFVSDGPLTCCGGGCCTTDADCCGEMRCISAYEAGTICMQTPLSTQNPGEICVTNADCAYWPGCNAECVDQRCQCDERLAHLNPYPTERPLVSDDDAAFQAAELIAGLELRGDIYALYRSMHPDAQALIPQDVVMGWYRNEFLHFGEPAPRAVKIRFKPWVWEVTGQTYPQTAEVATKQVLADGTEVWDEVRLAKDENGNWCWFFGRTRSFVVEQLERFVRADPTSRGAWLGDTCTETRDCSQSQARALCVDATREGSSQRICLHGATGHCESDVDCHQEEGKTVCIGEDRDGYFRSVCLRADGASCKTHQDCQESLTCRSGHCAKAA